MLRFEDPFQWFRRAGRHRALWLGAPLVLYSWTLTGPLLSDDLHLVLKAEEYTQGQRDRLELYRFAAGDADWRQQRDRGTIPWWSPDTGRLDFFRPVTELSFYLDTILFGRRVFLYRLMSLAVFAAALGSVHWMFMQASGDPIRAGVATFFFGISQTVTPPVTWMSNRQDLFVVIGAALAAGAYWASRADTGVGRCTPAFTGETPRPHRVGRYVVLAVAAYGFALLSKEVAVALAGVVVIYEIVLRRKADARWARPTAGMIAVLLALSVGCFMAYYLYTRPWVAEVSGRDGIPTQLGSSLPLSLLLYAAVWTIGYPIDTLSMMEPTVRYGVALAGGLLAIVAVHFLRKSTRGDRAALFFALWALLFILPGLRALTASTRTLCTATVGWCYLLTGLIVPTRREDAVAPLFYRHVIYAANGIVSIGCVMGTVLIMNHAELAARQRLEKAVAGMHPPLSDGDQLILQRADSSIEMICAGDRLEYLTGKREVGAIFLMSPDERADLLRLDDRTLLMRSDGPPLLATKLHRLIRGSQWRPKVGDEFRLSTFTADVTRADADGGVREIRFVFPRGLDSPGLHFDPPEFSGEARCGTGVSRRHSEPRPSGRVAVRLGEDTAEGGCAPGGGGT